MLTFGDLPYSPDLEHGRFFLEIEKTPSLRLYMDRKWSDNLAMIQVMFI